MKSTMLINGTRFDLDKLIETYHTYNLEILEQIVLGKIELKKERDLYDESRRQLVEGF